MRVVLIILMGRNIINCCPVKRSPANGLKHQTQALMGATRPASPPLEVAFGACTRLHVYVLMDNDKLETLLKLNAIKAFNSRWTLCVRLAVKGLNCVSLFV